MSTTETPAKLAPAKPAGSGLEAGNAEGKREKRTITEIRESKRARKAPALVEEVSE